MPWETKGDKGRQNHLSPASTSRHAMGDKGRQGGDKAKSSQPSIQTCHGRQGETRGDKGRESSWPSINSMQELRTPHSKAVWGVTILYQRRPQTVCAFMKLTTETNCQTVNGSNRSSSRRSTRTFWACFSTWLNWLKVTTDNSDEIERKSTEYAELY